MTPDPEESAGARTRRRAVWAVFKWLITAAVFALIFSRIDWHRFRSLFVSIRFPFFLAATGWMVLGSLLDALAGRRIIGALGVPLTFLDVLRINYRTYFFAFLGSLPGGVARWAGLAGREGRFKEAIAAILVERYWRVWALYLIFFTGLFFQPEGLFTPVEKRILLSGQVLLGLVLVLTCGLFFNRRGLRLIGVDTDRPAVSSGGPWGRRLDDLKAVAGCFPARWRDWRAAFLFLFIHSLFAVVSFLLLMKSMGLSMSAVSALWIVSSVALAQMVPLTVYGLGIREGLLIFLLARHGLDAETAVVLGLLWFWAAALLGLAGGIWFLAGGRPGAAKPPRAPTASPGPGPPR